MFGCLAFSAAVPDDEDEASGRTGAAATAAESAGCRGIQHDQDQAGD